jgi:anti-sigma regulatory factor (Ser/Thr protein kinase)
MSRQIEWPIQHALRYDVSVPAHPVSIGFVRKATRAISDICGDAVADVLALVVTELVTNSVRHGGVPTTGHIDVMLELNQDGIRGRVADPGIGFQLDPDGPTPRDGGGFGLYIVDRLARDWGVDSSDGRTEVWFQL